MSSLRSNPFVVPPDSPAPASPPSPAPFGRRAAAMAIDMFAAPLCLLPGFIYIQIQAYANYLNPSPADPAVVPADAFAEAVDRALPVFLLGIAAGLIVQLGLLAFRSRTLGKHLLGLQIVRSDGRRVGVFRLIFIRTPILLLSFVPGIGQILCVINLVLALRPPHRAVHDLVAGTEVVVVSGKK